MPNQALQPTGAAIPVSRGMKVVAAAPAAKLYRVCRAWPRTNEVQILVPGVRGAEGQEKGKGVVESPFCIQFWTATAYSKMGIIRQPMGNRSPSSAPVNHYCAGDGQWVAVLAHHDNLYIGHLLRIRNPLGTQIRLKLRT